MHSCAVTAVLWRTATVRERVRLQASTRSLTVAVRRNTERFEQVLPAIKACRGDIRRECKAGNLELRLLRFAVDEPRVRRTAKKARVLTGPGQVAVVGGLFRQR